MEPPDDPLVIHLAAIDQTALRATHDRLVEADSAFADQSAAIDRSELDPATEAHIEDAHLAVVRCRRDVERRFLPGAGGSATLAVGALLAGQAVRTHDQAVAQRRAGGLRDHRRGRGRTLPVIVDDTFAAAPLPLPLPLRVDLLDALVQVAEHAQVIMLTDDPTVSRWARQRADRAAITLYEAEQVADESEAWVDGGPIDAARFAIEVDAWS